MMAEPGVIYTGKGVYVADDASGGFKVDGSKPLNRDLSTSVNWWRLRRSLDLPTIPTGKHWCSSPYHEGYNERGEDDGGWRPVDEFSSYIDIRGKKRLHQHCKGCRSKLARRMYAIQREAEGKPVRGWRRREAQAG